MNEQTPMLCERCGQPIDAHGLRLVKMQEFDRNTLTVRTRRLWTCLTCWLEFGGTLDKGDASLTVVTTAATHTHTFF